MRAAVKKEEPVEEEPVDGSPDDPAPQASAASSSVSTHASVPAEVVETRSDAQADASDARSISVQQAMYRQYLEKLLQAKAECMFPGFVRSGMADVLSKLFPEGKKEVSLASARAALFTVEEIFKVAAQSALNTVEEKLLASSSIPQKVVQVRTASSDIAAPQTCVPKPEPGCTMMLKRQYGDAIFDGRKLWEGRPKDSRGGKKKQLPK